MSRSADRPDRRVAAPPPSLWSRITKASARDIVDDGVPRWLAWQVFWAPIAGAVLLVTLFAVSRPSYYEVLAEDRPVEWLQFALCLMTALFGLAAARRLAVRRQFAAAGALLLVGLGSFFLAGEEISWAQRVFAFGTPEQLASTNSQEEFNLHNLHAVGFDVQDMFKIFSFLLGLGGVALTLATRGRRPWLTGRFWLLVSPPLYALPGFLGMVLYRPFRLLDIAYMPVLKFQEWVETALFLSMAVTAYVIYLRSARSALPVTPAEGASSSADAGTAVGLAGRTGTRPLVIAVCVVAVTVVFAALTAHHGIAPGNPVPR
ncbi:hypothetical protein [Blastococcus goldschmidtiae]|uniref:Uncharacterized protein n=1 Tax=Blastococcus goldschmidtiae TaxID=3075546 RepID=A0ABU2KB29_9ACTN|nr:hypothetical protein [Blastococcus sp. DSM 46792]MDT0277390.1 hypothetical protein [Blastococcus sp. DSM 46792]